MHFGDGGPSVRSWRGAVGPLAAAAVVIGLVGGLVAAAGRAEPAPTARSAEPEPSVVAVIPGAPAALAATSSPSTAVAPTTTTAPAPGPAPSVESTPSAATAPTPAPPAGEAADDSPAATLAETAEGAERHEFGTSLEGRSLVAWRRNGGEQPTRRELVVGVIHGEEPAGRAIAEALLAIPLPADLELWVVPSVNPDGEAVGRRGNANGVDLNRNFPTGWLPPGSDPYTSGGYHSGGGPASEPEVQAVMALIRRIRPQRTVWYHQPWDEVICELAHAGRACTDYAARVGRPAGPAGRPGSAIGWQQAEDLGAALVVELAEGPPSAETVERHAAAVLVPW